VSPSVKRDSSGCVNLRGMCPTFQPGLRFELRHTILQCTNHECCMTDMQRFNDMSAGKIAQAAA
jgi:hypothetical protein